MHNTPQQHNYVISLLTAKERRNHIIQEFGKQNIPFEFFDAITPDLIEKKAKEFDVDISNSPLTKGEIACALSHIALWHLVKENRLDYICIFEDDIYLGDNVISFLTNTYIPQNTHIVKFEKFLDKVQLSKQPITALGERKIYQLKGKNPCTAGYLLTNLGAKFLLDKFKFYNFSVPFDDFIFKELIKDNNYIALQIVPAFIIQNHLFESTLDKERNQRKDEKKNKSIFNLISKEIERFIAKRNRAKIEFK